MAVRVWLRASERISVMAFVTYFSYQSGWTYCPADVGMIRAELPEGRTESDGRKIRLLAIVSRARNEADDFGTHANASHNAMAIRPASASDIRYAVMRISLRRELNVRQIAGRRRSFGARTLSRAGGRGRGASAAPRSARSRVPANGAQLKWFGRRRAHDAGVGRRGVARRDMRPPSIRKIPKKSDTKESDGKENDGKETDGKEKPAADFSVRARRRFLR